jgi:outer membrane lipoprotein-sorting protein
VTTNLDARALLQAVAEAYANLKTLAVEFVYAHESGDDDNFNRSEQRGAAFFVAPDKVRIEQGGRRGTVFVTDGRDLHHYFGIPKHYLKSLVQSLDRLPGRFQPDFPVSNGNTFLFGRITEKVAEAEILREEPFAIDGGETVCQVVAVKYEAAPSPGLISNSPLIFWVDSNTRLIFRAEGTITPRLRHGETRTIKQILALTRVIIDQPIPPETFEYAPPADAVEAPVSGGIGTGIAVGEGSGGAHFRSGGSRPYESWHSHRLEGEAFIEQFKFEVERYRSHVRTASDIFG